MRTLEELEMRLAEPSEALIGDLAELSGDIIVIGAGGKLGPSLVKLAANASQASGASRQIIAVSRFGSPGSEEQLRGPGIRTVATDVTDERALVELPDAENVVYLVGEKFGSTQSAASTWSTNAYLPGRIAERFAGARIAALSTGTVYPMVPAESGGCTEEAAVAPIGDYAMSCVGRERILTHFAARTGSLRAEPPTANPPSSRRATGDSDERHNRGRAYATPERGGHPSSTTCPGQQPPFRRAAPEGSGEISHRSGG